MKEYRLRLAEAIVHCCDVKTFRFALPEVVPFRPGQYLVLTLNVSGKAVPKAFSISNSPTEKGFIQFTKRLTGSDYSNELNRAAVGQEFHVRFPMGKFTFEGEYPKVVFLSGGIGITPIRSIFKNATDRGLLSDMVLLYSSRTQEDLIFRKDFYEMQAINKRIKVVYTLTHCQESVKDCLNGQIDDAMIRQEVFDYNERVFFICGPPAMVEGMRSLLTKKLLVSSEKIVTEDFVGY